jgi:hypothetical protein
LRKKRYPQNISYITEVTFPSRLDLDRKFSFCRLPLEVEYDCQKNDLMKNQAKRP